MFVGFTPRELEGMFEGIIILNKDNRLSAGCLFADMLLTQIGISLIERIK